MKFPFLSKCIVLIRHCPPFHFYGRGEIASVAKNFIAMRFQMGINYFNTLICIKSINYKFNFMNSIQSVSVRMNLYSKINLM